QTEDGIRSPLVWIVRTAARAKPTAPLVGEHDFAAIVRKRSRMPVGIVWIIDRIQAFRMYGIFDVEHDSVAGARPRRQSDRRVHRDVVALVCIRRLLRALFAVGAAVIQAV